MKLGRQFFKEIKISFQEKKICKTNNKYPFNSVDKSCVIIIFERKLTTHSNVRDEEADLELINNYDLELK